MEDRELEVEGLGGIDYRTALVLFSGGFDSTAVVLKIIKEYDTYSYNRIDLFFEDNDTFEDNREVAFKIYELLKKEADSKGIEVNWIERKMIAPSYSEEGKEYYWGRSRDLCFMTHLSSLWGMGNYYRIFMGWNKSNIKDLKYSKVLLEAYEQAHEGNISLYFLEDLFLDEEERNYEYLNSTDKARITKGRVIKYLLKNNMFSVCQTGKPIEEGKHWYYTQDDKWEEVVHALVWLGFNAQELASVF